MIYQIRLEQVHPFYSSSRTFGCLTIASVPCTVAGTGISQRLFYFGADSARVYWILKKYSDADVKLTDSSIIKEWELLQLVATFLVSGGVASAFFSKASCESDSQWKFLNRADGNVLGFLCGLMLLLLFAVLLATTLCRMFLYGQYTMLLVDSKKMIDREAGKDAPRAAAENVRALYWSMMREGMIRFARITGMISAVSKVMLLFVILMWMTAILVVAADCSVPLVFTSLLVLSVVIVVLFFMCLFSLLGIAQHNASNGDWHLPNESLFDDAYKSI